MKAKTSGLKGFVLVASLLLWCAGNLHAQGAPTISTQPASRTNLAGTSVTFTVAADGPGPFTYQWQLNGTNLPNDIITTVAGNGNPGYSGDGGPATNAQMNSPCGVAVDAAGNLYVGNNSMNPAVRKIDINGIISTVAGNGSWPYSGPAGNGVPATNASLAIPGFVIADAAGNLYISEAGYGRVRKVTTDGILTTVAGSGFWGYSGDGGPATNANLFVESGPACGLALDTQGNLYIADAGNNRIRKVDTNGIITTVAGNGTSGYLGEGGAATNASLSPIALASDLAGNLLLIDRDSRRIRKVDANGIITTVAGGGSGGIGGPATNASLSYPVGIAPDAAGNLYISDLDENRVCRVDTNGIITMAAGKGGSTGGYAGDGGAATNASLWFPYGVAIDAAGNLLIADAANNRIREVVFAGLPIRSLTPVSTNDAGNYTVTITSPYGSVTSAVATLTVVLPPAILIQPASRSVMIGSNATLSVLATGTAPLGYSWYFNATNLVQSGTNAQFLVGSMGDGDAGQYLVVVTNAWGSVTSSVATLTAAYPPSVARQPASQMAPPGTNVSFSVTGAGTGPLTYQWQFNGINIPNGLISTVAGNGLRTYAGDGASAVNASLNLPFGVAWDATGNLYIADTSNNRVRRVDASGTITTVAGRASMGYAGDGGAATNASLHYPSGLAFGGKGDLYIADTLNQRIRKVDTNGIITTVAGKSISGYSGDGGAATNATLYAPTSVALDAVGNLYIADQYNNRIRRVGTDGIITTVAGKGTGAFAGDGGAATNASMYHPGVMVLNAAGGLYLSDCGNNRVRRVATNGVITTVAGGGSGGDGGAATNASLNNPFGLAVDAAGSLYVGEQFNNRIRKVDADGFISTVAGNGSATYAGDGGAATNASLQNPNGLALGADGNLYIADQVNNRVRRVLLYAGNPTFTLGSVGASNAGNYSVVISNSFGCVTSAVATLTVQAPPIITVQPANQTVAVGSDAHLSVAAVGSGPFAYGCYFAGTNLLQSGTNCAFALPGISTNDAGGYTIVVANSYGSVTSRVATLTVAFPPSLNNQPASLSVFAGTNVSLGVSPDGTGPFRYQWRFNGTNLPNDIITTVAGTGTGTYAGDGGAATNASLYHPYGLAVSASGNLYIADSFNSRIRRVDTNGIITTVAGKGTAAYAGDGGAATNAGLNDPTGVALDAAGNVWIADTYNARVRKVDASGIITTVAGGGAGGDGGPATNASLRYPFSLALDGLGNLYLADQFTALIRKVDASGTITTVAGGGAGGDGGAATNASLNSPTGVALDAAGNLFIADRYNNRIRRVGTDGIITTVAGNGSATYGGDGGAATNAGLYRPSGAALAATGDLYIADYVNERVRRVDANGIITTVAGTGVMGYGGDGGPATNASLHYPYGLALDGLGNLYISDQNNNCIRKVNFAGYPTLALTNVSPDNSGNYTVVVSSPYGSVTGLVATLTVTVPTTPPQIFADDASFGFLTNQFGFNVGGVFGQTIVVDGSSNLVDWSPLFTNTVGGSPFYFFDPDSTNFSGRFYRARLR